MQLNCLYTTLLAIALFAIQAGAQSQYTSSTSSSYYVPPTSYGPPDYTSCIPTTVTSVITTVSTVTLYTQAPYGYDNSYIPPMKKKTGLIIGLVVGLCGLALILLVSLFLLFKRKKAKAAGYAKETPATSY